MTNVIKRSGDARSASNGTGATAGQNGLITTFIVQLEDTPDVLERVAGLLRRRQIATRCMSIERTEMPGTLRMTLLVEADEILAAQLEANLHKLPNVLGVDNLTHLPCSLRELAVVKVAATRDERAEIMQIASVFRARVIDICPGSMIIESTGREHKIDRLVDALAGYGIIEMARTGPVAMTRGERGIKANRLQRREEQEIGDTGRSRRTNVAILEPE